MRASGLNFAGAEPLDSPDCWSVLLNDEHLRVRPITIAIGDVHEVSSCGQSLLNDQLTPADHVVNTVGIRVVAALLNEASNGTGVESTAVDCEANWLLGGG